MTSSFVKRPLSRRGFVKLIRLLSASVAACVTVAVSFNLMLFWSSDPDTFRRAMISALVLPPVLAIPVTVYVSLKLRQLSQLNRDLEYAATHDGLTALLNRSAFTRQVHAKIGEIADVEGGRGAFLLIDADLFKSINDDWGHSTGDDALRHIADQLRTVTRAGDIAGRLGGEEFGLFLPGAGMLSAEATAERLRQTIATMPLTAPTGEPIALTISVGGLFFRNEISFELMFQRADRMLYCAKAEGRNRVVFEEFKPQLNGRAAA